MGLVKAAVIVLDCSEPEKLSEFYKELLDGELRGETDAHRIEVVGATGIHLAFRRDINATPPSWPRPDDSQQIHLDIIVAQEDMDEAERRIIGLGGRPLDTKDDTGPHEVRLYSDPAGHPFALRCSSGRGPKAH
ncbi:VOC family protein [Streptomyces sp. NPDC003077]|uniref:VOC family protein n=1 Tax=Streptomyces sp. NPDC003077 TaxID=3154443 RepID=UPI0033B72408